MRNVTYQKKIAISSVAAVTLLYFMATTPSPKIILVPFLICSLALVGRYTALLFEKEKVADAFRVLFIAGFLLLLFGFLFAADFHALEHSYAVLVFSIPLWLAGIWILKNIFRRHQSEQRSDESSSSGISLPIVVSAILVITTMLAGIAILCLGIRDGSTGLVFGGAFFAFGAFTFVLAVLTIRGVFDSVKVDVLGMYMGIVVAAFGVGAVALRCGETLSLVQTIHEFGLWILVPIVMVVGGTAQIIKSLGKRKS